MKSAGIFRLFQLFLWNAILWIVAGLAFAAPPIQEPIITFYGDQDYPPYEFVDDTGKPAGFDVDLIQAVTQAMGVKVQVRMIPWTQVMSIMGEGGSDRITSMFYSGLRAKKMDFTAAHSVVNHAIFVRKGSSIQSLQDCADKAILVQKDDIMHEMVSYTRLSEKVYPVVNQQDALRLLASGTDYDCAILARAQAVYYIHKLGIDNLIAAGPPLEPRKYCFAVPKGNPELIALLNEGLNVVRDTGRYDEIREKWFGLYDHQEAIQKFSVFMMWAIGSIAVLTVLFFAWNYQLKNTLARKTHELDESRQRFQDLIQYAHVPLVILRSDGVIQQVNQSVTDVLGYTRDDMTTMDQWWRLAFPDETARQAIQQDWANIQQSSAPSGTSETITRIYPITCKNGRVRDIEFQYRPFGDWSIFTLTDITERKQAELALKKSEEKFSTIFKSCPDGIAISQLSDGRFLDVNESFLRLFKYDIHQVIGRSSLEMGLWTDPDQRKIWVKELEIRGEIFNFHTLFRSAMDEMIDVFLSARRIQMDGTDCILTLFRDVTEHIQYQAEKQELKDRLSQARKMESLGLLAGGVAHDLNNILSGIVTYPELILMDLPTGHELRKPIQKILDSGKRAASVVSDLLTVARGVATDKQVLNLNTIIMEYLDSPEYIDLALRYPGVMVQTDLGDDLQHIRTSTVHIKKALMNLITNAAEAIHARGTIYISTRNQVLDSPPKGYTEVVEGTYAMLRISDDGPGIPSENLKRIFEPFFTRKVLGRSGTGLGLTVVWNTMLDNNGYVEVDSDDTGTVFTLFFPVVSQPVDVLPSSAGHPAYLGTGERILVVDDDEIQRQIACSLLTRLGYSVNAVSSGELAVEYIQSHHVDLVILDMLMGSGMNGFETWQQITATYPNIKALIASGFSETEEVKNAQKLGAGQFVKKPYTLEIMGMAVSRELNGKR